MFGISGVCGYMYAYTQPKYSVGVVESRSATTCNMRSFRSGFSLYLLMILFCFYCEIDLSIDEFLEYCFWNGFIIEIS